MFDILDSGIWDSKGIHGESETFDWIVSNYTPPIIPFEYKSLSPQNLIKSMVLEEVQLFLVKSGVELSMIQKELMNWTEDGMDVIEVNGNWVIRTGIVKRWKLF